MLLLFRNSNISYALSILDPATELPPILSLARTLFLGLDLCLGSFTGLIFNRSFFILKFRSEALSELLVPKRDSISRRWLLFSSEISSDSLSTFISYIGVFDRKLKPS